VLRPRPPAAAAADSGSWWRRLARASGAASDGGDDLVPTQVPLGSVRASLGWASTFEDAYALVHFLRGYLQ
jgi:hypothetical protein